MTRRMLIVSPSFHGYHAAIARAFEKLGYDAVTYCYDAVDSTAEKVWNKLRYELPTKLVGGDAHQSADTSSRRAAERVRDVAPDVVLVVRGDTLTEEFWQVASAGGRPVVVWMYDEMRRTAFDASLVSKYARIASYSPLDVQALVAEGIEALHVPLGYDDTAEPNASTEGIGVVSFLGAPSPKRHGALLALHEAGIPVRAWGRGWSDHPFDRARTWRLSSSGLPNGRDTPGPVAHAIMRNSIATLNIHGDQDGFTMRTFEAAGSGGVQLVDRADVSEVYVTGEEVLVFENAEELVEIARRVEARPEGFVALREAARRRTLAEHTLRHRAQQLEGLW
ncbi:glycosyltransferase [Dermacoccus sp. PAMC28757]|uniref:CgeB family protein n=1 Tax=Dermacoccus sp. PAMC28757 TaxID=2762331 RepID=UPI00164EC9B8|nr:glycosyltransferase [Dermacoccus sp. PAMC28757]QNK54073.1 glycosyltransferase [Dermacoccus sp. PAMC28757]